MYHSCPISAGSDPLAVPRALVDRQWRRLDSDGWVLRGLTDALAIAQADPDARVVGLTFDDAYADFLGVLDLLAAHEATATVYVSTGDPDGARGSSRGADRSLGWDELAALPPSLVEVGSHGHWHRPLDVLPRGEMNHEVRLSRLLLEDRLGVRATSFCYPHGYANRRVRDAVAAAGYANACVVGRRLADPESDPYAVPRVQVTRAHDEAGIADLVARGEPVAVSWFKTLAQPAWRVARRGVYRTTGRILT